MQIQREKEKECERSSEKERTSQDINRRKKERVLEYHFIHGEYFSSVIESESPRAETSILTRIKLYKTNSRT